MTPWSPTCMVTLAPPPAIKYTSSCTRSVSTPPEGAGCCARATGSRRPVDATITATTHAGISTNLRIGLLRPSLKSHGLSDLPGGARERRRHVHLLHLLHVFRVHRLGPASDGVHRQTAPGRKFREVRIRPRQVVRHDTLRP